MQPRAQPPHNLAPPGSLRANLPKDKLFLRSASSCVALRSDKMKEPGSRSTPTPRRQVLVYLEPPRQVELTRLYRNPRRLEYLLLRSRQPSMPRTCHPDKLARISRRPYPSLLSPLGRTRQSCLPPCNAI